MQIRASTENVNIGWAVFTNNTSDTKSVGFFSCQPILQLSGHQLGILQFIYILPYLSEHLTLQASWLSPTRLSSRYQLQGLGPQTPTLLCTLTANWGSHDSFSLRFDKLLVLFTELRETV